jgi:tetratricopeptide (TPR) repeat protein
MKNLLLLVVVTCLLAASTPSGFCQSADASPFSLHLVPAATIPIGSDASVLSIGGGAVLLGRLAIPGFPYLGAELGAGYSLAPVKVASGKSVPSALLNVISGRIGVSFRYPVLPKLFAGAYVHGGYYYGFLNVDTPNGNGNNPMMEAGADLTYALSPTLSLGVTGAYRMLFGLSNEVVAGLGVAYHFPSKTASAPGARPYQNLQLQNIRLNDVFPVFYKYYEDHPVGSIEVRNSGKVPLEHVKVSVFVREYMDNPFLCKDIPFITGGGTQVVDLFALFNDKLLGITENTKLQISISAGSSVAGETYTNETVQSVRVYDRNAMTWDDDRHAAAFVSMKDPSVLRFSKNVSSNVKDRAPKVLNKNLLTAAAFFEALRLYGLTYAVDPTTPFTQFSQQKGAVDFLQFPNQTLQYKAGDCDDISILYSALLESVGIHSAFITVPGHIYVAVSLEVTPADARKQFASYQDLIVQADRVWLPVEITALSGDFLYAWQAGIKEWNEGDSKGAAKLIVLQEAWGTYEPVGFALEASGAALPDAEAVAQAYAKVVARYVERDLFPQTRKLETQIAAAPSSYDLINRLGVLYARYGVYDKAEAAFKRILDKTSFEPALVNMGHLAYFKNDVKSARAYYDRAYAMNPSDIALVLSLAKITFESSQYEDSTRYYSKLRELSPDMAARYSYLSVEGSSDSARASDSERMKGIVEWDEPSK